MTWTPGFLAHYLSHQASEKDHPETEHEHRACFRELNSA
jgi:hypothetical protein